MSLKGINVIIIAADERDAAAFGGGGTKRNGNSLSFRGVERGLAKEWVAAEIRYRKLASAVLLNMQVMMLVLLQEPK